MRGEHHVTVPNHDPLRVGTLSAILAAVAAHHGLSRNELLQTLFD
jgi:phage protein D